MLVPMRLSRIIQSDINEQQVLCLTEIADDGSDGERTFPILVGEFEAGSIHRAVMGDAAPRPLTHDLLKAAIEELGAEVKDVVISHLQDHTYFAKVRLQRADDDEPGTELDSRPSDAIALAVHHQPPRPIFVSDTVLAEVT